MNYFKSVLTGLFVFIVFFMTQTSVNAATFPVPGINVLAKSLLSGQVIVTNTDTNGNFTTEVKEQDGAYNVFFMDENFPPIKIIAKKGIISGRIVVLTDGTTTKDSVVPVKKATPTKALKVTTKKAPKTQ